MSTQLLESTARDFATIVLNSPEPVLVDFWGVSCPPCRLIAPILEELAVLYQGRLRVVKVNAEENPEIASRYGVLAMPSLLFFRNGQEAQRIIGAWPRTRLIGAIEDVLASA